MYMYVEYHADISRYLFTKSNVNAEDTTKADLNLKMIEFPNCFHRSVIVIFVVAKAAEP